MNYERDVLEMVLLSESLKSEVWSMKLKPLPKTSTA